MGLPPSCFYPLQAFRSGGPAALAQVMENFFRSGWDPLVLGGVDGSNAHPNLAGGGLSWSGSSGSGGGGPYPPKPNPPPHLPAPWAKRLIVELADETADARIQKKGAPGTPEKKKPGLEFVIDTTDTIYGKACFVAKQDLTKQIGSVILENPVTVTNPKMSFLANYGKMVLGTSAAHNWELHRNGAVSFDDDGSRVKNYRSSFYLGGDDLSVERSAAGKMLLRDPSGGNTTPMLQFGASSGAFPAIKATGGYGLSIRRTDDSAYGQTYCATFGALTETTAKAYLSTDGLHVSSDSHLNFAASADADDGADTGLARSAAGVVKTTDGSTGYGKHEANVLESKVATGTAPLIIASTTEVANLKSADSGKLGGTTPTSFGLSLIDDAAASNARTTLGLGTIATQDASAVAITGGTIDTASIRDFRLGYVTFTASSGGNNNVNSTTATAFVNAAALTAAQNYDVTLPDATANGGRRITVKVLEYGAATSTVTVKSAAGSLDQTAAGTGVPMDASGPSKVTYMSDGTNWWGV